LNTYGESSVDLVYRAIDVGKLFSTIVKAN